MTLTPLLELITIIIGVTLTSDPSWPLHITNICKKTGKQIGLLCRNLYQFADSSTLLKLYISLVRPLTEYACAIWDPHLSKDILALENTQKFALRVCNWRADYDLLLNQAHLPWLSSRREVLKQYPLFRTFTRKVAYHDSPLQNSATLHSTCQNWPLQIFFLPMHHLYWGLELFALWCCQQELFFCLLNMHSMHN